MIQRPFFEATVNDVSAPSGDTGSAVPVPIVPLEELLANDPNGVELKRLKEGLLTLANRVRRITARGLSPVEFVRHEALVVAIRTATDVVDAAWEEQNGSGSSR